MSLFEKLNNKRYNLQEKKKDFAKNPDGSKKNIIRSKPGEVEAQQNLIRDKAQKPDLSPGGQKRLAQVDKKIQITDKKVKDFKKNLQNLTKGNTDPNKATMVKGTTDTDLIKGTKATGDEGSFRRNARRTKVTGDVIPKKDLPKTKGVNQADVSKQAKDFTKQIEKKRVKKLPPIDLNKPTKRVDLRKVDKKISRKRPSNAPSLADVKKKIDVKNPVEVGKTGPKPVKGTVLKVGKGGFERVRKTKVSAPGGLNPEAQKILKKQISTDELLDNQKKIVNNTKNIKNTSKPNLFSKVKGKLKDFHKFMVKDAGTRKTSEFAGYGRNVTRTTYKNTLKGNTLKNINKVLPGKYKALAAIALGTYAATRGKKKNTSGGVTGGDTKFTGVNPGLKLDTGKKNT